MPRQLKVYAWQAFRTECPQDEDRHGQTNEYVAAYSKAEACRLFAATRVRTRVYPKDVRETTWPKALEKCMAKPLTVFWHPHASQYRTTGPTWRESTPKDGG